VFVTYAREEGPDDARRLIGVLERTLGPGALALAPPDGGGAAAARDAIEQCEVVVALIGPGWRAADDDLAAEVAHAFEHRVPVIPMLMRKARMPTRDTLPPALGPLLDNHPRLTVETPSDFYWDVTTSHLGLWLSRILDENRTLERRRSAAVQAVEKLARERRQAAVELERATAEVAERDAALAGASEARREAERALEARREESGDARTTPGLRVFLSYRAETGGDVRTLERDLRERLDGCRLSSSEPISDIADPAAIAAARIARADVVLALIGPHWTAGADGDGPRLDDAVDPVRLELEAALARGLPVIPVLTQRAPMPALEQLPESLRSLAGERPYELIVAFWNDGVADLVERLDAIEGELRRREKALEDAAQHQRRLERDEAGARNDQAKAQAAVRTLSERVETLTADEERAREEAEQLRHEHRDSNRAYLDGPGPITLDGRAGSEDAQRPEPAARSARPPAWLSGRVLLGAIGLIAIVVIIIVVSH